MRLIDLFIWEYMTFPSTLLPCIQSYCHKFNNGQIYSFFYLKQVLFNICTCLAYFPILNLITSLCIDSCWICYELDTDLYFSALQKAHTTTPPYTFSKTNVMTWKIQNIFNHLKLENSFRSSRYIGYLRKIDRCPYIIDSNILYFPYSFLMIFK